MQVIRSASPNFNDRKDGKKPSLVILHYTDMESAFDALARMQDPKAEVSAHYLIDEDGTVYQLVEEDKRAWHAGVSFWHGETDINSLSIGIELQNPGHSLGYRKFPEAQMAALTQLLKDIGQRHALLPGAIIGHSDVAPGRKTDPGELFDWERLAKSGLGLWPQPLAEDRDGADKVLADETALTALFNAAGYNPKTPLPELVAAFQRHYQPEKFRFSGSEAGKPDAETVAKLRALARLQLAERRKIA